MTPAPAPRRGVRLLRPLLTASLAFIAITCLNDRPSGPSGHARASLHLQSVARAPGACGPAPVIHPTRARVLLRQPGHTDSMVFTGTFVNDTVTLTVEVPVTGGSEVLDIDAQAIDALGDTVFRARDTVTAKEGDRTTVGYLQLWYSAPDSALASFSLTPRDTSLRFGGAVQMRATGIDGSDATFSGTIRLSFLSRDPTIVATSAGGAIAAQGRTGTTWLVATNWLGLCDSTTVTTIPPASTVTLTPDTIDIVRDGTVQIVAVVKDAAGNQLFGRAITWSSSNANASVDTTGLVRGLGKGSARITATSEGKSAAAGIGILAKPVARVTITPKTVTVNIATTAPLTAAAYDSANVANADYPIIWTSLAPAFATVSATGVVTGVTAGTALVTATAGGVADTATITVNTVGITSTVVTPTPDTLFSVSDSLVLSAKSYTGATLTPGTYAWVARDPAVATVNAGGLAVAVANGTTYVVATETGGTKDSARVTVQQRASAISLTPTLVQRYVGTTQTFVAAAQDARGNAIPGAPFTWSVSDPSVATVSAAGVATMLAIGTDTVKATIGTVVGKAFLTVKSPITRIAVAPGGIALAAIGQTQLYAATAFDTLDAAMTGVSFAWASTNPSVATVPGAAGGTQTATAAANGVTAITASAQGTTGSVNLSVAQVLVSIDAGPNPTIIGQGGQAQLIARGKDANGFFISGGTFTWASDAPTNVSVGATTGIVQALGTPPTSAHVTATSGTIVSNQVLVNVDNSVPARVSWGRDTLAIGRGSTGNSMPLYLSKPPLTTTIVNVAVRDTVAFFSPVSVSFAAGQTTANATLNGRNAGSTLVYATEVSGLYQPDTAVLLVQAASRFAVGSYSLNATDYVATQVLLTDPAPVGGVYLAFNYGTSGVAQVSPDPAFIPAGQLAANVNIDALVSGSTTITPSATGVTGTASTVSVQPPVIAFAYSPRVIGAGQMENNDYLYLRTNTVHPLDVTIANKDTTVARTAPVVTVLTGTNYVYLPISAFKIGVDTQTASAPGWTPATRSIIVSTPHLATCCATYLNTTSATTGLTAYVEDSVGGQHARINPLFVTVTSSDTTVIQVVDSVVTVPAGSNAIGARYRPGGNGGSAYVRVSAGGHTGDSVLATVTAPALGLSASSGTIGADQQAVNFGYVYLPNAVATAVPVTITSSDTTIAAVTTLVTVPVGSNYAYFDLRGHRLGTSTIGFTAPGYSPATMTITISAPRLIHCCNTTLNNFAADYPIAVYPADSLGSQRSVIAPLVVSFRATAPGVVSFDSTSVTIPAGGNYVNTGKLKINGIGTGSIIMTAPGYRPDTATFTIITPTISVSYGTGAVGLRQHLGATGANVQIPNPRPDSVIVHLANPRPTVLTAPDSIKIPKDTYYAYYDYSSAGLGRDTLTFAATGYNPAIAPIVVTPAQLRLNGIAATYNTTSPPIDVYATTQDTIGYQHYNLDTIAVRVVSSDTTVMKVDSAFVHIPTDRISSFAAPVRFVGPGSARIRISDNAGLYKPDSSALVTVVGPVLRFSAGTSLASPVTLGMRQHLGVNGTYLYVDNTVTGAPLVVNLQSTDPTVATVPASVTIPVGSYYAYFDIVALDTIGTIQIKSSATGYGPAVSYVQVGHPRFSVNTSGTANTTTPPGGITVYAMDQTGTTRYVTENVSVSLSSTNTSVAAPDSTTVTIVKDAYYSTAARMNYLAAGTANLNASDARGAFYRYDPAPAAPVQVAVPAVCLGLGCAGTTQVGVNEYQDTYVYIPNALSADLTVALSHSTGTTATPASVVIPKGASSATVRISGLSVGPDVITTGAQGFTAGAVVVAVANGMVSLSNWPASMKIGDSIAVQIYTNDQLGTNRNVSSAVAFTIETTGGIAARDRNGQPIAGIQVPANGSVSPVFYVHAVRAGQESIFISGSNFNNYANSITVQ